MSSCSICSSRALSAIDAGIRRGEALTAISKRFGVSRFALARHRDAHLFDPAERSGVTPSTTVDERLVEIEHALAEALLSAQKRGSMAALVPAARELRATLEALHRVRIEEAATREQVELTFVESMRCVRQALVETVGPEHPELLEHFEKRLEEIHTQDLAKKLREASGAPRLHSPGDLFD